ncbi:prefoldin subunit [Colletotrichum sojae]|uniref:Prefoldin subunit n=1 Tax=Colletotrichum sojae TaxID=2175907 RepID=A0A8H6N093_9PEZI|nr:prefoldin subunit [Colletotrichum sojae]
MRLPRIPRIHPTVLTRGRWAFAPARQAFCLRRPDYCFDHTIASAPAVENTSLWQESNPDSSAPALVDHRPVIISGRRSIYADLLLARALEFYRNPGLTLSDEGVADALSLAGLKDDQLSVVTGQLVLRISKLDRRIKDFLPDDSRWNATIVRLQERGYKETDVARWAWIMLADDADTRVYRFFSDAQHKPLFVLFYLLNEAPFFSDPECYSALFDYVEKWYVGPREDAESAAGPAGADLGMTPTLFRKVLTQLAFHASRLKPYGMRKVADLAVTYIRNVPLGRLDKNKAYKMQCEVFNTALQSVTFPARESPYDNMIYNWKAVTQLLSFSSGMQPTLIIERESYRAIRQVLLALPKSEAERDTASTLSSSWPPYRILRDGMEEKAGTDEYLSRTVKAGFMMQEAGYAKEDIDLTMDILGGMAPDGSPTVQTRANYSRNIRHEQAMWAALIRTTRNAQEAWAIFLNPPKDGMVAGKEVYWELITKLVARDANPDHDNLPGDGREVFPFNDANLSEYEKSRLRPPSIQRLTWWMQQEGIGISGRSLAFLIRNAPSIWDALAYVDHSSMDGRLKKDLRWAIEKSGNLPNEVLKRPPRDVLYAFIDLLCRLQPSRPKGRRPQGVDPGRQHKLVHYAIRLAQMGWVPPKNSGRAAWTSIMACLARPRLVVSLTHSPSKVNDTHALALATEVMGKAEDHCGLNVDMLISYALVVQKAVHSRLDAWASDDHETTPEDLDFLSLYKPIEVPLSVPEAPVFRRETTDKTRWTKPTHAFIHQELEGPEAPCESVRAATVRLKTSWRILAQTGPAHNPKPNAAVEAAHIHQYMRTLAFVGEYEEMVLLIWWVIDEWLPTAEEDATMCETLGLAKALCAFRAFAEPMVPEETVDALREKIESLPRGSNDGQIVLQWPADTEVDEYLPCDPSNQLLNDALVGRTLSATISRAPVPGCHVG